MNEFTKDAIAGMNRYIAREIEAGSIPGETEVKGDIVINEKVDHSPLGSWDHVKDGFVVRQDTKTGYLYVYGMTTITSREAVKELLGIEFRDYIYMIQISDSVESDKWLEIFKNFFKKIEEKKIEIASAKKAKAQYLAKNWDF